MGIGALVEVRVLVRGTVPEIGPFVAQIFNLLYRRIAFGKASEA